MQEEVLNEEGLVIINKRGKVLKRPHKPDDFRYHHGKGRKENHKGRKGAQNKEARDIMATTKAKKLQKYKNYLETKDFEKIEPMDIQYAVNVIRSRKAHRGSEGKPMYPNLNALQTCIRAYWDYIDLSWKKGIDIIPDVEGVASFLGMSRPTLLKWEANDYCGYGDTIAQLRTDIASVKKQLAFKGKIPPVTFATDFNNNHDYKQKQETIVVPDNPFGREIPLATLREKYLGDVAKPLEVVEGSYTEVSIESEEV